MPAAKVEVLFPKDAEPKSVLWSWIGVGEYDGSMSGMVVLADGSLAVWDVALGCYRVIQKKDASKFASVHGGPPVPEELT